MTYYYTKRAYQDTIVFLRDKPEDAVWYANERQIPIRGIIIVEIKDFEGKNICQETKEVMLQADASGMLMQLGSEWKKSKDQEIDPYSHYIRIKFIPENEDRVLENVHYLVDIPEIVNLKLLPAEICAIVEKADRNTLNVRVRATNFVPNLRIGIWNGAAAFSDNDFPLHAQEEKSVQVKIREGSGEHITLFFEACNAKRIIWKK